MKAHDLRSLSTVGDEWQEAVCDWAEAMEARVDAAIAMLPADDREQFLDAYERGEFGTITAESIANLPDCRGVLADQKTPKVTDKPDSVSPVSDKGPLYPHPDSSAVHTGDVNDKSYYCWLNETCDWINRVYNWGCRTSIPVAENYGGNWEVAARLAREYLALPVSTQACDTCTFSYRCPVCRGIRSNRPGGSPADVLRCASCKTVFRFEEKKGTGTDTGEHVRPSPSEQSVAVPVSSLRDLALACVEFIDHQSRTISAKAEQFLARNSAAIAALIEPEQPSYIYLASPYSHPDHAIMEQRFDAAWKNMESALHARLPPSRPP